MSESFEKSEGSADKPREENGERNKASGEIPPTTPVRHVEGSKLFHPDAQCKTLETEQKQLKDLGIGYLFKHLPGKKELSLCPDCDKKKIMPIPKDPYAAG